jgi:hypothetical protein
MKNPFNYLQFATGDQFYDRREILEDLRSRFLAGSASVVLYGPRRYGKSSLVAMLVDSLEKAGLPCVTLDVVKVPTIDLFLSAYATKVYRRLAPVRSGLRKLGGFFKNLRPKLDLSPDGSTGFSFEPAGRSIGSEALSEVLDLPQRLLSGNRRAVVVFDEFQEVESLLPDDRFERVMRSVVQAHRNVSYIFLGSRHHLLRRMFTDHARPFYKSALTIPLGKPPFEESVAFVRDRFASAGLAISPEAAHHLVERIDNIPYYVQQLGFETFRILDDSGRPLADSSDVDAAFARLAGFNRDQYEQQMLAFSSAQKALLVALAREPAARFDDTYRTRHALGASSTVNSAKKKLLEGGFVEQLDGQCALADPFFAEFLRSV